MRRSGRRDERSPRWTHGLQQLYPSADRRRTSRSAPPARTPAGASVEGETPAVVVPFAANVRFTAEFDELVWDETTEEMAVSVARSALASAARPERVMCARGGG